MKRYYLRVRVKSPVSISGHENRDGQTTPTLDYIPGSTLRGALAWHWLRRDPSLRDNATFKRLLDAGLFRCGALLPDSNLAYSKTGLGQVIPATARTCKKHPGFSTDPDIQGEIPHGVRDSLVALVEEEALARWHVSDPGKAEADMQGLLVFESCAHCGGAMDRFPGYFEWTRTGATGHPSYWRPKLSKRMITRSAILPQLESTAPNNLYSREVLEEGQHLAGWLFVDESIEPWMQSTFGDGVGGGIVGDREIVSVGAARTAGLGQVEVIDCRSDPGIWTRQFGTFDDRVAAFANHISPKIRQTWSLVPIALLSDTILLDSHLRTLSVLTADVLAAYSNLDARLAGTRAIPLPDGLELFVAVARTRRIAGWNTGSGGRRPRSDDWAVAAGSIFVLAAKAGQEVELLQLCKWLEENGIGERREDGFGQVVVAHPLHSVKEEV